MSLSGTLATAALTDCCNKQIIDLNKSFNVALETNNDFVSIVVIKQYSDYSGSRVQFRTEDDLFLVIAIILTTCNLIINLI